MSGVPHKQILDSFPTLYGLISLFQPSTLHLSPFAIQLNAIFLSTKVAVALQTFLEVGARVMPQLCLAGIRKRPQRRQFPEQHPPWPGGAAGGRRPGDGAAQVLAAALVLE